MDHTDCRKNQVGAARESLVQADLEMRGLTVYPAHGSSTHPDMVIRFPWVREAVPGESCWDLFTLEVRSADAARGQLRKKSTDRTDYYATVRGDPPVIMYLATRPGLLRFWEFDLRPAARAPEYRQ